MEVAGVTQNILSAIGWIITKVNELLNLVAGLVGDKLGFPTANVYLILLGILSMSVGYNVTEERGMKPLIIAAVIFAIFFAGGKLIT